LAIGTSLGTTAETQIGTSQNTSEIDNENQIKEQFKSLLSFHRTPDKRIQKIIMIEQFEPKTLDLFDPVLKINTSHLRASQLTQENYDGGTTIEEACKTQRQTKPNSQARTNTDRRARELNRTWENKSDLRH
jgi:hypothetical protein